MITTLKRWWDQVLTGFSKRGEIHVHKWTVDDTSGVYLVYTCECCPKKVYVKPGLYKNLS